MSLSIRQVATSTADQASAREFFNQLIALFDLSNARALDMFARTGELTVESYKHAVGELHCWELAPEHEQTLIERHNPKSVIIGDSYLTALQAIDMGEKYDLVVVDSPQGAHSDSAGYVHYEHFDIVRSLLKDMVGDEALIVLYVNKKPYNKDELGSHGYDQYSEYDFAAWMAAREKFYGDKHITEEQAISAYRSALSSWATVEQVLVTPCHSDVPGYAPYAFRLGLRIKRK